MIRSRVRILWKLVAGCVADVTGNWGGLAYCCDEGWLHALTINADSKVISIATSLLNSFLHAEWCTSMNAFISTPFQLRVGRHLPDDYCTLSLHLTACWRPNYHNDL